jgi:acetolactate synthase I/II/III large subunit
MKATDVFVQALENEGVEFIFGIPGEENLDFLESLKRSSQLKLILTRHEQGAGFMAATYGRLTGKPGVCLATLGPGATNFLTPAAYAQLGGMPLIMITGQKPIKSSKQGRFQIIDVVEIMRPVTKMSRQIVNGSQIPSLVREAFRLAQEERPGAILLECPEDIAREDVEAPSLFTVTDPRRPSADEQAIKHAVTLIEAAKMPLLLIGAGANRKRTSKALTAFVCHTGIPFFDTQMGKGVVDERNTLFMGTAALSDGDYLHCAINRADLIINVGHDVVEKPPFFMKPNGRKVIHINFSSAEIDAVYFPQHEVIGDISNSIDHIRARIRKQTHWDFTYFKRVKAETDKHIHDLSGDTSFPIKPQKLVADIRTALPSDGIVTLDNGIYKLWFARNYLAHQPNTLLLDNALATMGAGLASGLAAKLVYPERQVISVCGDGGFMMNSQEIETAIRTGIHIICIVLNDSAYGMIKWKQSGMGFEHFGLDYGNPDFVKYADSYGAHGHRIESNADLLETLRRCLSSEGFHLIEVPVDYSENNRVLIDELKHKACLI